MFNFKHYRRRIQLEEGPCGSIASFCTDDVFEEKVKCPSVSFFNSYVLTYATRVDILILLPSFPLAHVKFWYITLQMIYKEKYKG